jgi:hypothetical protein
MDKFSRFIQPPAAAASAAAPLPASVAQHSVITSQPLYAGHPTMVHQDDDGSDANLSQDHPSLDGKDVENLVPLVLRKDTERYPLGFVYDDHENDDHFFNRRLSEIFSLR